MMLIVAAIHRSILHIADLYFLAVLKLNCFSRDTLYIN
jgi:hypothetical protein